MIAMKENKTSRWLIRIRMEIIDSLPNMAIGVN